jgi:hypothetical protein
VCPDLGISGKKAHNLRRQLTPPQEIRERVAERPSGNQLSATLANRLADMHEVAPELTKAVAGRVSSSELHDAALRDVGGFVHRTVVESDAYAVRIDDGALLDAHEEVKRARPHPRRRSVSRDHTPCPRHERQGQGVSPFSPDS